MLATGLAYALHPAEGGRLLALRSLVGISGKDPASRTTWVDVGYTGEWNGHQDGPFSLTDADLRSCVEAFNAQVNPIGSDYEHASLRIDGEPKPASLWVQQLRVANGHLWALCELTPRAASLVRSGEYRYCSGVFAFNVPDRKDGSEKRWPCVLRSIALTNDPFLDGQQPIALTRRGAKKRALRMDIPKQALLDALAAIDGDTISDASLEPLIASVVAMQIAKDPEAAKADEAAEPPSGEMDMAAASAQLSLAVPPAPPATPEPPPPEAAMAADLPPAPDAPPAEQAQADAGAMIGSKLTEATGLEPAALLAAIESNLDAVVSAIKGSAGQAAELSQAALTKQVAALSARLSVYEKREADAERAKLEGEVKAMLADGKILPDAEPEWRALAQKDARTFRSLAAKLPRSAAFPAGRDGSLAGVDKTAGADLDAPVDETNPQVVALKRSLTLMGASEETVRKAVAKFGKAG